MSKEKKKPGRKRNYEAYVRDYKTKAKKLAANSVAMYQRMYSEQEFNEQYERLLNERKQEVKDGKRKTTGNIVRTLVDKQAFLLSAKQAEAMSNEDLRKKYNYYQRRQGLGQSEIKERYDELKKELEQENPQMSEAEINKYARDEIGTEFFGS